MNEDNITKLVSTNNNKQQEIKKEEKQKEKNNSFSSGVSVSSKEELDKTNDKVEFRTKSNTPNSNRNPITAFQYNSNYISATYIEDNVRNTYNSLYQNKDINIPIEKFESIVFYLLSKKGKATINTNLEDYIRDIGYYKMFQIITVQEIITQIQILKNSPNELDHFNKTMELLKK